ncbi:hypothetical protein D3C73_1635680 [compost metagenome]
MQHEVADNEGFSMDEDIILAKIDKRFFAYETENKNEDGENYWDFKEKIYNLEED